MNESLRKSLKKAGVDLLAGSVGAGLLAGLAFLADPVALAAAVKDPSPQVLLLIPAISFAAKVASDQVKHRFIPWFIDWLGGVE